MNELKEQSISNKGKILVVVCTLLAAALTACSAVSLKGMENHECLVSVTAREMIDNNDWVMPTCNGELRLQKTPLSYWFVAGLSKITGQVDELTARLPSAILAFLSAAAILYFVNSWLGLRIAVISTLVWATSFSYIKYSHTARPEMSLAFFIMLCFLTFYSAVTETSRKKQIVYMLVFWASFGVAMLAKGPAPLPLVSVPLFAYIVISRQWKIIPKLLPIVGTIIFLAIVLPWPLAIAHRVNWDLVVWKENFFDRFFGKFDSGEYPFYFYLPLIFSFASPWFSFVPSALLSPFYKVWDKKRKVMLFLWLWFVADLVFMSMAGGKRKHYILPVMPAMAILIGIVMEDMIFDRRAFTQKFAKNFLIYNALFVVIAAIGAAYYAVVTKPEFAAELLILVAVALTVTIGTVLFFVRGKTVAATAVMLGGYCVLTVCFLYLSAPFDKNNYTRTFAFDILNKVPSADNLVGYNYVAKRVVHYYGKPIPVLAEKDAVYEHYERGDWVLATDGELEQLEKDGRFRKVYHNEDAEMKSQSQNIRGSLFHKTAEPGK
jgi:4-amino-4-deoxy-L-arabinose transferase-like glycosyltransferase